jgi:anti-sigma B factor antagonist
VAVLDFRVEVDSTPHCLILRIIGELDIATAPQVVQALEGLDDDAGRVTVDLLDTSFIDSTGLTTLFRAHKRFEEAQREFRLVCGPGNIEVLRVIDLMGFDEVFTMYPTLAEAGCEGLDGPQT